MIVATLTCFLTDMYAASIQVQAPLPSSERVANAAEIGLDLGKRGIRIAARELNFYFDLIDVQLTRTLTRAQWDILVSTTARKLIIILLHIML
jgi:hypothetical protein